MNKQPVKVNRGLIGAIALTLLCASAVMFIWDSNGLELWTGACLKVGVVMGALWLALPSITRKDAFGEASWSVLGTTVIIAIVVTRTRMPLGAVVPFLVSLIVVLRFLGPRRSPPRS